MNFRIKADLKTKWLLLPGAVIYIYTCSSFHIPDLGTQTNSLNSCKPMGGSYKDSGGLLTPERSE